MKKISILLALIMLISAFAVSCNGSDSETSENTGSDEPKSGASVSSGEDAEALRASYDRYPDFITAPNSNGDEVFVDPENGRVMNNGAEDSPFVSLQQALLRCKAGDTIILRGGTYTECLYISTCGAESGWITIIPYKDEKVVFDDQGRGNSAPFTFQEGSGYIRVKGIEICNYAGAGAWVQPGASHIYLEDLYIHDISNKEFTQGGTEGVLGQGDHVLVRNCRIENIGQDRKSPLDHGIYLGTPEYWVIDSNTIKTTPGGGIQQYAGETKECKAHDVYIWNNTITDSKIGIILSGCKNFFISNNTIANVNYSFFFMLNYVHDCVIQNNIFYSNKVSGDTYFAGKWDSDKPTRAAVNAKMIEANADADSKNNKFDTNILYSENIEPVFYVKGMTKKLADIASFDMSNNYTNFITENPLLTAVADLDFSITDSSPAKGKGISNEYTPEYNILGDKRENVNLGAY